MFSKFPRAFLVYIDERLWYARMMLACLMLGAACFQLESAAICSTLPLGCFVLVLLTLVVTILTVSFLRCMAMMGLYLDRMEVLLGIAVGRVAGYDGLAGYEHAGLSVEQDG